MATPRKRHRRRDRAATIRQMIDYVGVILRESGYRLLYPSEFERKMGKDRSLVYKYFDNINNLLRAYLKDKDYWLPYFERFEPSVHAGEEEVRAMFIQMMQENLKFFMDDKEMQSIVLWQISEARPMLRALSAEREAEGEKLLALTDPHFKDSEVDFRAVICLLLGGTYYAVLHASTNKTTVAGIDLNKEKDLQSLFRTIEQIISWAWDTARDHHKQKLKSSIIMDYELEKLQDIANDIAAKENTDEPLRSDALAAEVKRLEWVMLQHILQLTSETQVKTYVQISLSTLVKICDKLYRPGSANPDAELLLDLMDVLRSTVTSYVPGNIALPKLFRAKEAVRLTGQWEQIKLKLSQSSVDRQLLEITGYPYSRFADPMVKVHWGDYKYLRMYAAEIERLIEDNAMSTQELANVLIGLGYNHARFMAWYSKNIQADISVLEFEEIKKTLTRNKATLRQLVVYTHMLFYPDKASPTEQLSNWIDAELVFQKEIAPEMPHNPHMLHTRLQDLQLVWWQTLQQKHGIYHEDDQSVLLKKARFNFKTASGEELDEFKLQLDPRESDCLKPLEGILASMLEEVRNVAC